MLGRAGERYAVRVENPTSDRIEVVVSVDGRDAVSGRVADYRRQRGYVIAPRSSIVVDGFRRSLSEVAAFRFSNPSSSYSARRGTPENVGVIGVAFFSRATARGAAVPSATAAGCAKARAGLVTHGARFARRWRAQQRTF
ncbi:MAG: hypothetical protein QM756_28035 [Polyangiaceae bacterium]